MQHVRAPHRVHVVGPTRVVRAAQSGVHERLVPVTQDVAVAQLVVVVLLAEGVDVGVGVCGVDVGGVVEVHGLLRGVGRGEVRGLEVPRGGVGEPGGGGEGGGVAGDEVAEAAMAAHQVGPPVLVNRKRKQHMKHVKHVKHGISSKVMNLELTHTLLFVTARYCKHTARQFHFLAENKIKQTQKKHS